MPDIPLTFTAEPVRGTPPGAVRTAELRYGSFDLSALLDQTVAVQRVANALSEEESESRRCLIGRRAAEPRVRAVGAFAGRRLVGFAYGAPLDPDWPWADEMEEGLRDIGGFDGLGRPFWLLELHVVPSCWRRGIGTSLVERLCRPVRQRWVGLTRRASSDRARVFYESLGFADVPGVVGGRGYVVMGARRPIGRTTRRA
nr:GNAT family N-acetyltransferase [Kitasatospora sp. MBT63]